MWKKKLPKPAWRVRKEAYVVRVGKEPAPVILVSASDKLHNASAILADYREIGDARVTSIQQGCRESRDHWVLP